MKINFGLLGLGLAQSGDYEGDGERGYDYDYNLGNHYHTHNSHNHYASSNGYGYGDHTYQFNSYGGKAGLNENVIAHRLSCWNSNNLRDLNFDNKFHDTATSPLQGGTGINNEYHHYHHQYGFENTYYTGNTTPQNQPVQLGSSNGYGDQVTNDSSDLTGTGLDIDIADDDLSVRPVDPAKWGYQNDNPDAKYHYGHHIHDEDLSSNVNRPHSGQIIYNESSFYGVIDDWRYSLRHAGCLYEIPDWFYGLKTYKNVRILTYSYDSASNAGVTIDTTNYKSYVHWVHVFNAHIHIDETTTKGVSQYCAPSNAVNGISNHGCANQDPIHQFAVVMANPTYEGLGFLNFVATYHDSWADTNAGHQGHRFQSSYAKAALYENAGNWWLSDKGGIVNSDTNAVTWHLPCNSTPDCANDTWKVSNRHKGLAISSFPHNQLGKDFRFNIRTLHTMGHGKQRALLRSSTSNNTAYSYFFYGINEIHIYFPEYVARVNDCWRDRNTAASNATNAAKKALCKQAYIHQIIVDQSSVQFTSASPQNKRGDIAWGNVQLRAALHHSSNGGGQCTNASNINTGEKGNHNCASWCHTAADQLVYGYNSVAPSGAGGVVGVPLTDTSNAGDGLTPPGHLCGNKLSISGIINTYDELHLRQFGTIQEIWVQLMYAFSHSTLYDGSNGSSHGFESPFPNVFFSAPQVYRVEGKCSSNAYGKCTGYTREQNMPYPGTDNDSERWVLNGDGLGGSRGESFWPDNWPAKK